MCIRDRLKRYSSTISDNESQWFWSNISGQVFQHAPQLTQAPRSIVTFMSDNLFSDIPVAGRNHKGNEECRRITPDHFLGRQRSVSYTHLRAHETDSYLVCRLL